MATPQEMGEAGQQAFQKTRNLSKEESVKKRMNKLRTDLDPSSSTAVQELYKHMPEAVKEFDSWKEEYEKATDKASEIGSCLSMACTGNEYTEEEFYEEFVSEKFINEIKELKSDIAYQKATEAMQLAQDAARDFGWWERFSKDAADGFKVAAGTSSYAALAAYAIGVAGAATASCVVVPTALAAAAVSHYWFGHNRSGRNKEGKDNLVEKANVLSDLNESIQQDIITLNRIGVYVDFLITYQEKAKKFGRISRLLEDKIARSAKEMVRACRRLKDESSI